MFAGAMVAGATYEGGITLYKRTKSDSVKCMRQTNYRDRLVSEVAEKSVFGAAFATVATLFVAIDCAAVSVVLVGGKLALDWLIDLPEAVARLAVDWAVDSRLAAAAAEDRADKAAAKK